MNLNLKTGSVNLKLIKRNNMDKNYKYSPFLRGDTVYHPVYGEGVVAEADGLHHEYKIDYLRDRLRRTSNDDNIAFLSFTPYEINSNWERPWEPKDGDIVFESGRIIIINNAKSLTFHALTYPPLEALIIDGVDNDYYNGGIHKGLSFRPATPEEAQKLFDALEKEGWKWNVEKKELEKIPEPLKEGDLGIAWDKDLPQDAIVARYARGEDRDYQPSYICRVRGENLWFTNAVKFESMEQFEKIRRGEI